MEVPAVPADPELLFDGPSDAPWTVVLAHGAGAGMDTPFMDFFAKGLAERGFRSVRFEFPYMAARRTNGKQKPPDREPVLRETWLEVVNLLGREGLIIGGKSMGGRMASLVADEAGVAEHERLGILGMRERMLAVGGELLVDSAPGKGTRIVARAPSR